MKTQLQTNMNKRTLHLINTYAPQMCYGRNERDAYWGDVKYILGKIPKNDFVIWATDNNGQIARPTSNNDRGEDIYTDAHVGHWHYAKKREKGNGEKLVKILYKYELSATKTTQPPRTTISKNRKRGLAGMEVFARS